MNATLIQRLKAFMIDYIFIFVYILTLLLLSVFLFPSVQQLFTDSHIKAQFAGFLFVTLPVSLYFIISDSVIRGQTFGKKKMGIRVVDKNGKPSSVVQATLRTLLKFLPWELSHYFVYRIIENGDRAMPIHLYVTGTLIYVLIFTYLLTAIFTKKKQSLYDLLAKTEVINISSIN